MSVQPVVTDDLDALRQAQIGSVFTRSVVGWDVKWVDGGTMIFVQGATISEALASHGLQIVHPITLVPQGIVEVERPDEAPVAAAEAPVVVPVVGEPDVE